MKNNLSQYILDQQHFDNPQPGDYWHEMFFPYFIVLHVIDSNNFVICDKTIEVDDIHWTWDISNYEIVNKEYFNRVLYNNSPGYVANVVPNINSSFVKKYKEILEEVVKIPDMPKVPAPKPEFDHKTNRIVCAANRYTDGTLIVGVRHFCSTMQLMMEQINTDITFWRSKGQPEQGFIDKFGQFKTRTEALEIAKSWNQIVRDFDTSELFSENLY